MNKFEQAKPSNAGKRKERAEAEGKISISHWRGELHSHTATNLDQPETPEDVIGSRKGSNCGKIPLEVLTQYHANEMLNEFIAITEHSRDADPAKAIEGITAWFNDMYLNNASWLQENFGKNQADLSTADKTKITKLAKTQAEKVALYKDERLEEVLADIDQISGDKKSPIKVFKGVEANLLPDGSFDTEMVDSGQFEIVNCSIHPHVDQENFTPIIQDPKEYTELTKKGMQNPRTNVMCHIGHDVDAEVVGQLDWDDIAKTALENEVAIEINLKDLMAFIYDEILDYEKFPSDDRSYVTVLKSKLPELTPLISSPKIKKALAPYLKQGLKIAINTDEHENKFIESKTDKAGTTSTFKERGVRFWRCMSVVEKYFNTLFEELGIDTKNIINTYSKEDLEKFIQKK
mgnify:CR=1 FL=1